MELINKKETEIIIGILFNVYNELGWGYREKYYERAIAAEAKSQGISIETQLLLPIQYKEYKIGYSKIDLLFYKLILVELKVGDKLTKKDFDQINEYLKALNLKIGLLVLYSPKGVQFRRIANLTNP